MNLRPFFTFYGGKWRIAKNYPKPLYNSIIEPFAGSAGYSVHYSDLNVVLYDVDPIIFGVWDFLIKSTKSDIESLPVYVEHTDSLNVSQEAKWLIGFWLNKGTTAPCKTPGKWMRDYSSWQKSYWGEAVRARIAAQVEYIKHWKIYNKSYYDIGAETVTWFVDPPYIKSGVHYRYSDIDYENLAGWCRGRCGQVIVCEQEGAAWLPFQFFREIKSLEGTHGKKKCREVVWTNK